MALKFLTNLARVWKITKKPSKKEYYTVFKIVLVGFLIIGVVGFVVDLLWQILLKGLF